MAKYEVGITDINVVVRRLGYMSLKSYDCLSIRH